MGNYQENFERQNEKAENLGKINFRYDQGESTAKLVETDNFGNYLKQIAENNYGKNKPMKTFQEKSIVTNFPMNNSHDDGNCSGKSFVSRENN